MSKHITSEENLLHLILSNGGTISYYYFEDYISGPGVNKEKALYIAIGNWVFGDYCEAEYCHEKGIQKGYDEQYFYHGWIPTQYWGEIKYLTFRINEFICEGTLLSISDKGAYIDFPMLFKSDNGSSVTIKNLKALERFLNNRGGQLSQEDRYVKRAEHIADKLGDKNIRFHYEYYQNLTDVTVQTIANEVIATEKLNALMTLRFLELQGISVKKNFHGKKVEGQISQLPYTGQYDIVLDASDTYRFNYPIFFKAFGGDNEIVHNDHEMIDMIGRFVYVSNMFKKKEEEKSKVAAKPVGNLDLYPDDPFSGSGAIDISDDNLPF